jgi:hypothetical protein
MMFHLWLADVPPNTNYGEYVAAAYEAEHALADQDTTDAYVKACLKAEDAAWQTMTEYKEPRA